MRQQAVWFIGIIAVVAGCVGGPIPMESPREAADGAVRFVPLGDSYTIGTAVAEAERWPNQLVGQLDRVELVGNPAVNGYTSADLIRDELPQLGGLRPDLVSVLIGVNDVIQGVPPDVYAANVGRILDEVVALVGPNRVVCLATPDYTRTPQGSEYGDPEDRREGIRRVNAVLREVCEARSVTFVPETFAISEDAAALPELVAADGLHPSGEQYRRWVDALAPVVADLLTRPPR